MSLNEFRLERDSMGELRVPAGALWGAQTQRAVQNFPISGLRMPRGFIRGLGLVKWAAAGANLELGGLDKVRAFAIQRAALEVAEGRHDEHFPVDVFQTGSGTSSNMNANEVIAHLATQYAGYAGGTVVHPNDDVNRSQSSNDVVPTVIHLSAALAIAEQLLPALKELSETIGRKAADVGETVKTGRTHLMDAMPLTLGQELGAWRVQVDDAIARFAVLPASTAQPCAGRHGGRHGHQCSAAVRRERCCASVEADRPRPASEPRFLRVARFPGHGGRGVRAPAHARRQPDEDRERPALDEQRSARRAC